MPLIVWDLKRGIPIWLFMLIAGGFLCFIFFDNGGLAVYTRSDATLGSQIVPVLLGLLVLLLIYAVIITVMRRTVFPGRPRLGCRGPESAKLTVTCLLLWHVTVTPTVREVTQVSPTREQTRCF